MFYFYTFFVSFYFNFGEGYLSTLELYSSYLKTLFYTLMADLNFSFALAIEAPNSLIFILLVVLNKMVGDLYLVSQFCVW